VRALEVTLGDFRQRPAGGSRQEHLETYAPLPGKKRLVKRDFRFGVLDSGIMSGRQSSSRG
jgi:hypothetical protein